MTTFVGKAKGGPTRLLGMTSNPIPSKAGTDKLPNIRLVSGYDSEAFWNLALLSRRRFR